MAITDSNSSTPKEAQIHARADDATEKLEINTTRTASTSSGDAGTLNSSPWKPSLFRIRPLIGIAALLVAVICLFISLGILLGSDGAPVDAWYFQPTVYLAIATAVSNTALNAALAQAAPISWWYKAYKGSTVRDLELEWEAGQSFGKAIFHGFRQGRHFSLLMISSLVVALVVVE